jgi:hypothetical protein
MICESRNQTLLVAVAYILVSRPSTGDDSCCHGLGTGIQAQMWLAKMSKVTFKLIQYIYDSTGEHGVRMGAMSGLNGSLREEKFTHTGLHFDRASPRKGTPSVGMMLGH